MRENHFVGRNDARRSFSFQLILSTPPIFVWLVCFMSIHSGTHMPCFYGGHSTVQMLRQRFNINLPEGLGLFFLLCHSFHLVCFTEEFIKYVEDLIAKSCNNWHTRHYDKFQFVFLFALLAVDS